MPLMQRDKVLAASLMFIFFLTMVNTFAIVQISNSLASPSVTGSVIQQGSGDSGLRDALPLAGGQPQQAQQPTGATVDDDPVKGSASAPVTIIEFSDFQCPFCSRFWKDTLPLIEENYIKTGKAKLVYRDFPLGFHPQGLPAAEAAECANEQGKFWEMHDKIYANQDSMSIDSYKKWAKDLGLDASKFSQCLDSEKYKAEVLKDQSDGQAAGVSGTPTFYINGVQVVGAQPYDAFKQVIDSELSKRG